MLDGLKVKLNPEHLLDSEFKSFVCVLRCTTRQGNFGRNFVMLSSP